MRLLDNFALLLASISFSTIVLLYTLDRHSHGDCFSYLRQSSPCKLLAYSVFVLLALRVKLSPPSTCILKLQLTSNPPLDLLRLYPLLTLLIPNPQIQTRLIMILSLPNEKLDSIFPHPFR